MTIPVRSFRLIHRLLHRPTCQIERSLSTLMPALVTNANRQTQHPVVEHRLAQYLGKSFLSLVKRVIQVWALKAEIVSNPFVTV